IFLLVMASLLLRPDRTASWLGLRCVVPFFSNATATTEIYTLSLHDALPISLPAKAELLATDDVTHRLERLADFLVQELQVLEVGTQIQEKVKTRLDQNQREYVLREQLQVIRQELGEGEGDDELEELGKRLEEAQLSPEAKKVAERELK